MIVFCFCYSFEALTERELYGKGPDKSVWKVGRKAEWSTESQIPNRFGDEGSLFVWWDLVLDQVELIKDIVTAKH